MEAPAVFHRCVRQALTRPVHHRQTLLNTKSTTKTPRHQITRTSSRHLTLTSRQQQQQPTSPQPEPVSQEQNPTPTPQPDPAKRIDLSPLTNQNPFPNPRPKPSASTKLDSLFGPPSTNPFTRTIQKTDATNPPTQFKNRPIDIAKLLDHMSPKDKSKSNATHEGKMPLRLRPALGRTIAVDPSRNVDLSRGFRFLDIKVAANQVKRDALKQRIHVRRGRRRKLERSARWRVVFKTGFLEECARVRRMKNQGW